MANFPDVFSSGRQGADEGGASHLDGANGGRNGSPHVRKTHLYSRIILSCRERRYRLRSRNPQGDRHNGPDPRSRGCAIHTQDAWEPRLRSVKIQIRTMGLGSRPDEPSTSFKRRGRASGAKQMPSRNEGRRSRTPVADITPYASSGSARIQIDKAIELGAEN